VRDLIYLYERIHAAESKAAARWFNRLEQTIHSLTTLPRRCPVAAETGRLRRSLRCLLYGRKPDVYRVVFEIDEREKAVRVLTIRHGAMDRISENDLRISTDRE